MPFQKLFVFFADGYLRPVLLQSLHEQYLLSLLSPLSASIPRPFTRYWLILHHSFPRGFIRFCRHTLLLSKRFLDSSVGKSPRLYLFEVLIDGDLEILKGCLRRVEGHCFFDYKFMLIEVIH